MAREAGAFCLAMVNDTGSPVAAECAAVIDIRAGRERSVAATKSVLATMAAGLALVDAWKRQTDPAVARLPARLRQAASLDWSALTRAAGPTSPASSRSAGGPRWAWRRRPALKLAETCGIAGLAFSAAEIAHGPMALAGPQFPVLAFLQNDASLGHTQQILGRAGSARRARDHRGRHRRGRGRRCRPCPRDSPDADLLGELLCFYLAADAAARARARPGPPAAAADSDRNGVAGGRRRFGAFARRRRRGSAHPGHPGQRQRAHRAP